MEAPVALWVSFEGLSGGGKTTAINSVVKRLTSAKYSIKVLSSDSGEEATALHRIAKQFPLGDTKRLLLFWTLRLLQYEAVFATDPEIDIIITDRFWGSTLAIDEFGNGVPHEVLSWVGSGIRYFPDITLLFQVPVAIARARKPGGAPTLASDEFAERVCRGYQQLALEHDWIEVNGGFPPEVVARSCEVIILNRLRN